MIRLLSLWPLAYISTIVVVNLGFSYVPPVDVGFGLFSPMALVVGFVFIVRDFAQRAVGDVLVLIPMAIGLALSYVMADPFVATASAVAFLVAEGIDWVVFTVTKKPMRKRIIISNAVSIPVDSFVFLYFVGIFTPATFAMMVVSKLAATVLIWVGFDDHEMETDAGLLDSEYGSWRN